jgi:hypothetical protein
MNTHSNKIYFCVTAAEVNSHDKLYELRKAEYIVCLNTLNSYKLNTIAVCSETKKDTTITNIIKEYLQPEYFKTIQSTNEMGAKTKSQQEFISLQLLIKEFKNIHPNDWVIKISGRYLLINESFINIVKDIDNTDIDFVGKKPSTHPQIYTFLYAIRYKHLQLFLNNGLDYLGYSCIENKLYDFLNQYKIKCKFIDQLNIFTNIANDGTYILF